MRPSGRIDATHENLHFSHRNALSSNLRDATKRPTPDGRVAVEGFPVTKRGRIDYF
jgi:hypothetical protein